MGCCGAFVKKKGGRPSHFIPDEIVGIRAGSGGFSSIGRPSADKIGIDPIGAR